MNDRSPGACVIELVGPAGSGKTTLARALPMSRPSTGVQTLWGLPRHTLLAAALALAPIVAAATLAGRPFSIAEIGCMVRIGALRRVVRESRRNPGMTVLDEGPVFGLTWLEVFFARRGNPHRARWRRQEISAWARLLDAVVRLDAVDPVLIGRINGRAKPHLVKNRPADEVTGFTGRFRLAFDEVIGELAAAGRVHVLDFRADSASPDDRVARLRSALAETADAG